MTGRILFEGVTRNGLPHILAILVGGDVLAGDEAMEAQHDCCE